MRLILGALVFAAQCLSGAIILVNHTYTTAPNGTFRGSLATATPVNTVTGDVIAVGVMATGVLGTVTVSDSTSAGYASAYSHASGGSGQSWYWFYLPNITGTTGLTVTAHFSGGGATYVFVGLLEYSIGGASPLDLAGGYASGSGTALTSASFSTSAPNEVVIAFGSNTSFSSYSAGTIGGAAATMEITDGNLVGIEDLVVSNIQTGKTATMTASGSFTWFIGVVSFRVSGACPAWQGLTGVGCR